MIKTNPLSEERRKSLSEQGWAKDQPDPDERYELLKQKLLSFGGEAAILYNDPDLEKIIERGCLLMGDEATLIEGIHNQCHGNSGANFLKHGHRIMSGYSLSKDGAWRQHTWNLDRISGEVIETTTPRLAYFGFELDQKKAQDFAEKNPIYEDPAERPSVAVVVINDPNTNCLVKRDDGLMFSDRSTASRIRPALPCACTSQKSHKSF